MTDAYTCPACQFSSGEHRACCALEGQWVALDAAGGLVACGEDGAAVRQAVERGVFLRSLVRLTPDMVKHYHRSVVALYLVVGRRGNGVPSLSA